MVDRFTLKDSGEREEFDTGSRRDTRVGKGRFDLFSPFAMRRLARVYEKGAAKYGDRNMERGQPLSRYIDSAMRHLTAVIAGDDDEDHAGQAAWNVLTFIHTREMIAAGVLPSSLDDLPDYEGTPELCDTLPPQYATGGIVPSPTRRIEVAPPEQIVPLRAIEPEPDALPAVPTFARCCGGHTSWCVARAVKCCASCPDAT